MNWFTLLSFVFLGTYQLVKADLIKEPVSKLAILSASPISYGYMRRMKENVITNCEQNGYHNKTDLETTYDDLVSCVNNTALYSDKKQEFLKHLEGCSTEPIKKAKSCLKKEHQYYPDMLLKIAKSQISFICDHHQTIKSQLIPCFKSLEKDVRARFDNCLTADLKKSVKDVSQIPATPELFCQKYSPAHACFSEVLNRECTKYPNLKQFGENYEIAMNFPCNKNITQSLINM